MIKEKNLLDKEEWASLSYPTQQPMEFMLNFLEERVAQGQVKEMDLSLALAQFTSAIVTASIFGNEFISDAYNEYINKMVDFTAKLWST